MEIDMKKVLLLGLFCLWSGWGAAATLPASIPASVNVVIKANLKNDAMAYNINDDDVLMAISVDNRLPFAIVPDSVTYDLYLRANDPATHQLLDPVYVGSGQLLVGTIPIGKQLTLPVPAGASAWVAGQDIFSAITILPNNLPYPNIQKTPHQQGVYTVIFHFSGHNIANPKITVTGETSVGFGINTEAPLT